VADARAIGGEPTTWKCKACEFMTSNAEAAARHPFEKGRDHVLYIKRVDLTPGRDPPRSAVVPELAVDALEKEHRSEGAKLVRALGGDVINFSQTRKSKVGLGIADDFVAFPRLRVGAWWEGKRTTGRHGQSTSQQYFQGVMMSCHVGYILGGYDALEAWIIATGHFRREGKLIVPITLWRERNDAAQ
jgi:hypothetical protein